MPSKKCAWREDTLKTGDKKMNELKKIASEIKEKLNVEFFYYQENTKPLDVPVCDKQFDGVTDDGANTFFRFLYRGVGYIGVLDGVDEQVKNYAFLLPAYLESFSETQSELTKTEFLKRILLGEVPSSSVYKYMTKYSVRAHACFALVIRVEKLMEEVISLIGQYTGNSLDTVVQMDGQNCAFVRFLFEKEDGEASPTDYAEFLAQTVKEELGVDVTVGVGSTVKSLKEISLSYMQASSALHYAEMFESKNTVHSYREYMLVKLLEEIPEARFSEYLAALTDEKAEEIWKDEEMLSTAEEFLRNSLNVSETSRNLYMHRNTLLYRLDKIKEATGLNIRSFADAVSFRVLTILNKLRKQ